MTLLFLFGANPVCYAYDYIVSNENDLTLVINQWASNKNFS